MQLDRWARLALRPKRQAPAAHHVRLLAELAGLAEGRWDRLLVTMPPGMAKSTYASVLFPAWWLRRWPRHRVIAACHTEPLAAHFGRQVRGLLAAEAGTTPGTSGRAVARDDRAAARFATAAGGGYFGVGVRGPLAGRRAELVVIDDPIRGWAEADSAAARDALWDWYRADLSTRLSPGGRIAVVMTRWHDEDLAGRLLASEDGWRSLVLPALAGAADPLGRAPGAPLWPQWEDAAALARRQAVLGPRAWAALYQCAPRADAEALFQVARVPVLDEAPPCRRVVRAWDLAATAAGGGAGEGRDPDWTVGIKLGRTEAGGLIVLDVQRFRAGPNEVAQAILRTARLDGRAVAIGLPQDPGQAGKQQVAWLATLLTGFRVVASPESGSKLTRAQPAAAAVEAGTLAVLRGGWNAALLGELRDFPAGRKDDQVDALARALSLLAEAPARRLALAFMGR